MIQKTSYRDMECPIARGLEQVGEWWSILIIRDLLQGFSRFDELQASLGVATNTLARRLQTLVDNGLVERRPYSERPLRCDYVLTEKGRDFAPVLFMLLQWGSRHASGAEGPSVLPTDRATGAVVEPIVVDRHTALPLTDGSIRLVPGPGSRGEFENRVSLLRAKRRAARAAGDREGNPS